MGHIVTTHALPKRCNRNSISKYYGSLGNTILADGEIVLVSSDNSMATDGTGNFDCYVKGDGVTKAYMLEVKKIDSAEGFLQVDKHYWEATVTLNNAVGGVAQTLIDGFPAIVGHTYNIYAKSKTSVGKPNVLQLGLGSNGYENITVAQLLNGVTVMKTATTASLNSRVYLFMTAGTSAEVYVRIEDATQPTAFSGNFDEIGSGLQPYLTDDIIATDVYKNVLNQLAVSTSSGSAAGYKHKPLNLLHFSDIHGDGVNLRRVIAFKSKYTNYITDVIHTGDSINSKWSDNYQFDFWTASEGSEYILNTIGNHDCFVGSDWYGKTAAESYATFIAPFVSNWDVESTENLCYYYKDYSDRGVRLIVIDVMHWDATQLSWLETTLAGAKTNSLHVIIAGHSPAGVASNGNRMCNFDQYTAKHNIWEVNETFGHMNASVSQAVDTFIQGGGTFVCYICGHTHMDLFRKLDAYNDQYYIAVPNASCMDNPGTTAGGCVARHTGDRSQDLFNIISIDVSNKHLTLTRIGNEFDCFGRHQGGFLWDYGTREILFQY